MEHDVRCGLTQDAPGAGGRRFARRGVVVVGSQGLTGESRRLTELLVEIGAVGDQRHLARLADDLLKDSKIASQVK